MGNPILHEDTLSQISSVEIWLRKSCGSKGTAKHYRNDIRRFFKYAGVKPDDFVAQWKSVKYDYRPREQFIDEWTEKIEEYIYSEDSESYTPSTRMFKLAVIVSFFKHNRIPVEPEKQKHVYVKFHNRDIAREEVRRILEHVNLRDRTFFLMMLESGLRPITLVQLRYKHIKRDFEANKVPMMIELPSELLKDRVSARWTFIGQDAFQSLKEHLKPRMPLKNEDVIFQPERKDATKPYPSPAAFSRKFSNVALKLGIAEKEEYKKPKKIRLYCLRKWFNNNCRYDGFDSAYKEFWIGHQTTQTAYISRNPQRHREEYSKAYPNLRIYKPTESETTQELRKRLEERDKELAQLRENMKKMQPLLDFVNSFDAPKNLKEILDFLKDDYLEASDETLRPLREEFSPYISDKLDEIAKTKGITQKEALEQLVKEDLEILEEGDKRFRKLEKRLRKKIEK